MMEIKPFFELVKNSLVVKITHMVVVLLKDAQTLMHPFFLLTRRP